MEDERIAATIAAIPARVSSVLDVGCGDGRLTNKLVKRIDRVVGLDISAEALKHVETVIRVGQADALPFEPEAFDLVLCTEVLEHLEARLFERTVRELGRVSRRYVLVSVPFEESLENATGRCHTCGCVFHVFRHHQSFGEARLPGLIPGFRLASWRTLGPPFFPPRRIDVLIQQRLLSTYFKSHSAVCPACGQRGTACGRFPRLARLVRASRRLPRGRQQRHWLLALYKRRGGLPVAR